MKKMYFPLKEALGKFKTKNNINKLTQKYRVAHDVQGISIVRSGEEASAPLASRVQAYNS